MKEIFEYVYFFYKINLDSPEVRITKDLIESRLNENITLECNVLSRPLARIYWEKNGKIIEKNSIIIQKNQTLSISHLNIQVWIYLFFVFISV